MRVTRQKEIEGVLKLDGPARLKHFVQRVVDEQRAWGLWNDGWASGEDDDGVPVFPLWPAREYAEMSRTGYWAGYEPKEIPLDDLLNALVPMLIEKRILPGVFPTPAGKWVIPTADGLCGALRKEMEKYQ